MFGLFERFLGFGAQFWSQNALSVNLTVEDAAIAAHPPDPDRLPAVLSALKRGAGCWVFSASRRLTLNCWVWWHIFTRDFQRKETRKASIKKAGF